MGVRMESQAYSTFETAAKLHGGRIPGHAHFVGGGGGRQFAKCRMGSWVDVAQWLGHPGLKPAAHHPYPSLCIKISSSRSIKLKGHSKTSRRSET